MRTAIHSLTSSLDSLALSPLNTSTLTTRAHLSIGPIEAVKGAKDVAVGEGGGRGRRLPFGGKDLLNTALSGPRPKSQSTSLLSVKGTFKNSSFLVPDNGQWQTVRSSAPQGQHRELSPLITPRHANETQVLSENLPV